MRIFRFLLGFFWLAIPALADDVAVVGKAQIEERIAGGVAIALHLDAPAAHRVFTLSGPNRLVIDLADTDLGQVPAGFGDDVQGVADVRAGLFQPGWSRLVADLEVPLVLESVLMQDAVLTILLQPADQARFDTLAGAPPGALWDAPESAPVAGLRSSDMREGKVLVAIDPGHGGIDPGASREGVTEKDLALAFGLELRAALEASGRFEVVMTRESDVFVSLRDRVEMARSAGADVFLSLHLNTVAEGDVSGATVYALSETASDASAKALAEFENQSDTLAGLDNVGGEDQVALALIDMARRVTDARSAQLGTALVEGFGGTVGVTRNRPFWTADLRVLKAPDMPSLLLELGFLSDETDRQNLQSPHWRARAIVGVIAGLDDWVAADRERALRQ